MSSRFAKLVNAQVAREQEAPREKQPQQPPTQSPDKQEPISVQGKSPTPVTTPASTPVVTPAITGVDAPVENIVESQREPPRTSPQYLDATHTASEQRVYSVMYRETVSRGIKERHFGPKELCEKTGIRSDRTIRTALDGLISKLSVEIVSHLNGSPLGPRYRVFEPKEIVSRRKAAGIEIDPQSKRIITPVTTPVDTAATTGDKSYRGTGVDSTGVTGVEVAGVSNKYRNDIGGGGESAAGSSSNSTAGADDEAFAALVKKLRTASREVSGKEPSRADAERWAEVAELLVTELKVAASRTSVTSAPAFLAEHLRRRLRKADSRQIEREVEEAASGAKEPALSRPELTHEQVQEQANLISSLLRDGAAIEELEGQFATNFRPSQWHMIRSVALAQAKVSAPPIKPKKPAG
jgi:hypothetical protein